MNQPGMLLIVNDDPGVSAFLKDYFGEQGYGVVHAASMAQLSEILQDDSPELVLLDATFPESDRVAEALQEGAEESKPDVILISGDLDPSPESESAPIIELDRLAEIVAATAARRSAVSRPASLAG